MTPRASYFPRAFAVKTAFALATVLFAWQAQSARPKSVHVGRFTFTPAQMLPRDPCHGLPTWSVAPGLLDASDTSSAALRETMLNAGCFQLMQHSSATQETWCCNANDVRPTR